MGVLIDETGRAEHIVSLLPAGTEMIAELGATERLVGRSHECDEPLAVGQLPVLTEPTVASGSAGEIDEAVRAAQAAGEDLYRLDEPRLRELRPDLIITQGVCAVCAIDEGRVRALASSLDPPAEVLALSPTGFEDVLEDLVRVGTALGLRERAIQRVVQLRAGFFEALDHVTPYAPTPRVVFLEWTDPLMVAGHWTVQLIERAGGEHPLNPTTAKDGAGAGAGGGQAHRAAPPGRWVSPDEIISARPDAVIVCPCGMDLESASAEARRLMGEAWFAELPAAKAGRVVAVDGNRHFNRPGPRLVEAYRWLVGWLNGVEAVVPKGFEARAIASAG